MISARIRKARRWATAIEVDALALWLAACDRRTPWHAKALAALVAAYALSPIDLIPDFIPVIGYLDDIVLVPLGIMLVVALIPGDLMAGFRFEAQETTRRPTTFWGIVVVAILWIAIGFGLIYLWVDRASAYERLSPVCPLGSLADITGVVADV